MHNCQQVEGSFTIRDEAGSGKKPHEIDTHPTDGSVRPDNERTYGANRPCTSRTQTIHTNDISAGDIGAQRQSRGRPAAISRITNADNGPEGNGSRVTGSVGYNREQSRIGTGSLRYRRSEPGERS